MVPYVEKSQGIHAQRREVMDDLSKVTMQKSLHLYYEQSKYDIKKKF